MEIQHKNLADEKWFKMTLSEQLGNVGSEYGRAWQWRGKNRLEYADKAFDRMLELLDLTIEDPRWQNHRLKELLRLREQACEEYFILDKYSTLSKYLNQFAQAARLNR